MMSARLRDAPRKRLVLVAIVALVLPLARAQAGEPQLTLPIMVALSLGASALRGLPASGESGRRGGLLGMLPQRIDIPDAYEIDLCDDPAPWAMAIDNDKLVAFDLIDRRGPDSRGWRTSISYDAESRTTFRGKSGELIRLIFEYRF
jgi:hypothetical protein